MVTRNSLADVQDYARARMMRRASLDRPALALSILIATIDDTSTTADLEILKATLRGLKEAMYR